MKLKNIILFGTATLALAACDDLFEPALENNQDISQMYTDPQFARGIMDNANLVLPYDESPTTELATDNAVSNDNSNNYKRMTDGTYWTSQTNPINQWETRYHAIQYLNLFLEGAVFGELIFFIHLVLQAFHVAFQTEKREVGSLKCVLILRGLLLFNFVLFLVLTAARHRKNRSHGECRDGNQSEIGMSHVCLRFKMMEFP